ncbi:MAG: S8 family serine peptidase [Myxococcota bacterium]
MWIAAGLAAELPDVGELDRYRVDVPDWPGAEATSATGSVLLAPPPAGTKWRHETPPVPDTYDAVEAIEALGAESWHARGEGGKGVKVAVFDVQFFNAAVWADELGDVATHDCQAHRSCDVEMDTLRPRYSFEEGSHGVACAEVIRDLAPEAELHLVRVNGETTLQNAAEWAVREGIDLVSMSMSFFHNSFHDGSGPVNEAVDTLTRGGVLLVNSAGNYATEHWSGDFVDADGDGAMEFPWGSAFLPVYWGEGGNTLQVAWDQFGSCGDTDLDVYVFDEQGDLLGRGEASQDPTADHCSPIERVSFDAPRTDWYYVMVVRYAGDPVVPVAIWGRGGEVWRTTPGSLADPASHHAAFTVGAVRATGYLENGAESFSSEGPSVAGVPKPDIAGPDGLTTAVYGSVGFYGTSASTPAVAGALALLLGEDPDLGPYEAAERLKATASNGRATWQAPDPELGAGYARLPQEAPAAGLCGGRSSAAFAPLLLMLSRFRRRPVCSPA